MKPLYLIAAAAMTVVAISMASCQPNERNQGWSSDLDTYIAAVKRDHYVYRSKELPERFQSIAADLRKNIQTYSDQRILMEFEHLAAQLGDGHTYILPWAAQRISSKVLPFRFYLFSDGLFIIDAEEPHTALIGSRVDQFGPISASEALKKIGDYVSRDNEQGITWIGPLFLQFEGTQELIGAARNGKVSMALTGTDGNQLFADFDFGPVSRMRGVPKLFPPKEATNPPPMYLSRMDVNYWIKSLPSKTLYVQFNQVWDDPTETLQAFSKRLGDSLRRFKPSHLVIDVRHNNGGNAMLLDPLLNEMKAFKALPGTRITMLTGRNTFSACQIFISRADAMLHPVFAGEPSSSKPNFVGEEHEIVLPWSGARGSISNRYHESIPGDNRQWIEPQIKLVLGSKDYFANRDPLLDAVISNQ